MVFRHVADYPEYIFLRLLYKYHRVFTRTNAIYKIIKKPLTNALPRAQPPIIKPSEHSPVTTKYNKIERTTKPERS